MKDRLEESELETWRSTRYCKNVRLSRLKKAGVNWPLNGGKKKGTNPETANVLVRI